MFQTDCLNSKARKLGWMLQIPARRPAISFRVMLFSYTVAGGLGGEGNPAQGTQFAPAYNKGVG
jgi:hypothetical protein